jgi:large conductance mechanosensitive channel
MKKPKKSLKVKLKGVLPIPEIDPNQIKETGFNFIKEFKSFAIQGNMIDLAVGFVVGAAFNSLVQSLVKDLIMPIFGWIIGGTDFSSLYISLNGSFNSLADAQAAKAPLIMYGLFMNQIINFTIVSFSIFIVLKVFLRRKAEDLVKKDKK